MAATPNAVDKDLVGKDLVGKDRVGWVFLPVARSTRDARLLPAAARKAIASKPVPATASPTVNLAWQGDVTFPLLTEFEAGIAS